MVFVRKAGAVGATASLAVALAVGLFGAGAASAATASHRDSHDFHGLTGTVSAIGTGSFTISRGIGSVTVDVSSSTTYSEHDVTGASFASLTVGDRVGVAGTRSTTAGTVDALRVAILPFPHVVFTATVSAIGTGSFTATRGDDNVTVDVSSTTTYSGVTGATFSSLAVGDHVVVWATKTATVGTFDATHVAIRPFPHVVFDATVTAIGTGSFTASRGDDGTVTVDVSSTTTYSDPGVSSATFANLAVGDRIVVWGTKTATAGTVNALHVGIQPFTRVEFTGTVSTLGTSSFTLLRGHVTVTVDVSSMTTYSEPRVSGATFANLAVGDRVEVNGTTTSTAGTFDALHVAIVPAPHIGFTGIVSTIGTSSFTMLRGHDTVTIDVSSMTTYSEPGVTSATFANLAVGDRVEVNGTTTSTVGTFVALHVAIVPFPHVAFTATVSALGTGSFTVLRGHDTVTVDVSTSTTYSAPGVTSATFANLAVGDRVEIGGTSTATEGTVDAEHVVVLPFPSVVFSATVSAIGTGSFTVTRGQINSVTVDVSSSTTYTEQGVSSATFANLAVGQHVLIFATETATAGTVAATHVAISS